MYHYSIIKYHYTKQMTVSRLHIIIKVTLWSSIYHSNSHFTIEYKHSTLISKMYTLIFKIYLFPVTFVNFLKGYYFIILFMST